VLRSLPLLLLASGCLARYAPPRLDPKTPLTLELNGVSTKVEIVVDARGIPHVFGQSEPDLAFGLGFMHGRERTFQVLTMKHAARGRLTELFGVDALPLDQRLRLLTHRLSEGFQALAPRDRATLEAYAKGVNAGAAQAGPPAELAVLGLPFGVFTAEDSLAIMRLQSWSLSGDHRDELARAQLLARLAPGDPRAALFDAPVWTGGVPIVDGPASTERSPAPPSVAFAVTTRELPQPAAALAARLGLEQLGASNSWAVHGSRTESGAPVLCNDPHLGHEFPSVFYLAHLEHPDFTGAGVTFAGIPAVLIGHTRSLAWGMTVSYADSQDLFRLQPTDDGKGYLVDGAVEPFERVEQRFRLGRAENAEVKTETWLVSRFGPVLPESFVPGASRLALAWPTLEVGGPNVAPISGFWDFLRAKNVDEATSAIERFQMAGQNVALAFTDGTIAYRLATYAPERPAGVTGRLPRDGTHAIESRLLPQREKPELTNPAKGYLVAANQRVIGDQDSRTPAIGTTGVPPHRARRIHERLEALLGAKKATADELLALQQDVVSLEARDLVPVLGAACPSKTPRHDSEQVKAFCEALRGFDGVFSTDSLGALPFVATMTALRVQVVRALGFDDAAEKSLARSFPVTNAVHLALLGGGRSPLFGRGLESVMVSAVDDALDDVVTRTGERPSEWRWGAVHTLQAKGVLAQAPIVGGFFTGSVSEQSGHGNTVRAESGLPVDHGAALRMVVELSTPPRARFTIDTGQSGAPKEPHAFDQFEAWTKGRPSRMPLTRAELDAEAEGTFVLLPAPPR